jgi:hypothetical protein
MRYLFVLLVATFLVLGAAHKPASASIIELGTISGTESTSGFVVNLASNIKKFDDTISFSLTDVTSSLVGSVLDLTTFPGFAVDSANFKLDLFTASNPTASLGSFADASGVGLNFSYLALAAGDYFFRVTGDTGVAGNAYTYKVDFNAVPIPPAILLFGTALGGLGLLGYRRRKLQA